MDDDGGNTPTPTAADCFGIDNLTPGELDSLSEVVRALVEHDLPVLERIGAATNDRDPYRWTKQDEDFPGVVLLAPPGEPSGWAGYVFRRPERPGWAFVDLPMWTVEDGPSDFTLTVNFFTDNLGNVATEFENLLIM